MSYIPGLLLFAEAALSFYKYFSPGSFFGPSILDVVLGGVFLVLAFVIYKNSKNRVLQWVSIILSMFFGPGGFIGFGGLFALGLAISYIVISKRPGSAT